MDEHAFIELSIVVGTTLAVCGLLRFFRQPIMIGYIIAGILISPNVFNLIGNTAGLSTFSEIGISLLLFMVGLGLNPKHIKEIGGTALGASVIQVLITSALGFSLSQLFGFDTIASFYIALGLSFSSTIVIMKLLSDKLTLETLAGKISVGMLIIEDLIAMILLMFISATSNGGDLATVIFFTLGKGAIVISILALISIYVLPYITKKIASSQELLLLFSIAWCLAISSLFQVLNFSIEIGALLAGITLSLSPYRYEISSKMRPLRDFFIMLFFVYLGTQIVFNDITTYILPILVFSALVLFIKPIIVIFLIGKLNYTKKTSFYGGINFSQISEFSLILATLGMKVGHFNNEILSLLTILALITITGSTYFINYSDKIFAKVSNLLTIFEKKGQKIDYHKHFANNDHDVILIGYSKLGPTLVETFKDLNKSFFVVDYDPKIVRELEQQEIDCLYGDISNFDTFDEINLQSTKMIISTIKDIDTNLLILNKIRPIYPDMIFIGLSHQTEEALTLYEQGANYVIMPYHIGSHHASTIISEFGFDWEKFLSQKNEHVKSLMIKKQLGHSKS